jgi:hypothetical protein
MIASYRRGSDEDDLLCPSIDYRYWISFHFRFPL